MSDEGGKVISYRLSRAREAIEEARVLFEAGHANTYVTRLYYACYYAASALLFSRGFSTSRHTRVRSLLHQEFVKPGLLSVMMGQHFDRLFDSRQKGDYADFAEFQAEEVSAWLAETRSFVDRVEALLQGKPGE